MSRRKPPRLYLKQQRSPRSNVWYIRDGEERLSTGCREQDLEGAQRALRDHIDAKFQAPQGLGSDLLVVEAVASYLKDHALHSRSREFLFGTAKPILAWWSGKKLRDVNRTNCRAYVAWRTKQRYRGKPVSDQTARHDLKTMRAAINWYKSERDTTLVTPVVTLPPKAAPRLGYYLEREEVAARLRTARASCRTHHVARMILIGIYTGTRPGAILRLRWASSVGAGWFDLRAQVLYRAGTSARPTSKRQPPIQIHARLLPHLQRWQKADAARGIPHVIHYLGQPVTKLRSSWKSIARAAGHDRGDAPHILRHTAATWMMRSGVDIFEAAGFLGMSPDVLWEVYGHHHPRFQRGAASATGKRSDGRAK